MLEENIPDYLYHYTTIKTLPFMFQKTGEVEFRFTDYRFLNDAEEGLVLKKIIEKNRNEYCNRLDTDEMKRMFNLFADHFTGIPESLRKSNFTPYIMSFTKMEDSMQFWLQDYAKDKGVCLKLNTRYFKAPNKLDGFSYEHKDLTFNQVHYVSVNDGIADIFPKLQDDLRAFLETKRECDFDEDLFLLEFLHKYSREIKNFEVKNKVWESEAEWRLKIVCLGDDDSTLDFIQARYEIDDLGIPRAKITIKNPIEEIILGPSFSPQYVDSIKKWLKSRHFDSVNVRCGDGILND